MRRRHFQDPWSLPRSSLDCYFYIILDSLAQVQRKMPGITKGTQSIYYEKWVGDPKIERPLFKNVWMLPSMLFSHQELKLWGHRDLDSCPSFAIYGIYALGIGADPCSTSIFHLLSGHDNRPSSQL